MDTALFLAGFVALGLVPGASLFFTMKRAARVVICLVWLAAAAAWLLSASANSPHSYGIALFMVFFIGWMIAFALILSRQNRIQKNGEPQA